MKTLLVLAWRNLWRKKKRTLITVSSVMFAAILTIALMSIVSGMKQQMIESIVSNTTGHIQIQDVLYDDEPSIDYALELSPEVMQLLEQHENCIAYTVPRIQNFCLASKDIGTRGVLVTGIKPEKENKMNNVSSRITQGRMFNDNDNYAVVAEGVANQLELELGDTIVLLGNGFQGMIAASKYKVGGIVRFPMPEQNNSMVYLPLAEAQWLFAAPDRVTNLIIMAEEHVDIDMLSADLQSSLDDEWFTVYTWEELLPDAIAAFEVRNAQVKMMAWILYAVVGFGILGTIITMVFERMKEFGILLSIGLKRIKLAAICMLETLLMSFLGVLAGIAIGYPLMYSLYKNPIPLKDDLADVMIDMGIEPVFAFSVAPEIFLQQGLTVFFIAVAIGLYPVVKVLRLDMVKASRK